MALAFRKSGNDQGYIAVGGPIIATHIQPTFLVAVCYYQHRYILVVDTVAGTAVGWCLCYLCQAIIVVD